MSLSFGTRLRHERVRRGLSQEAMAEAVGTSVRSLGRWEQGLVLPQGYSLVQLSRFLGVPPEALLTNQDIPSHPEQLWTVPYPRNPFFTARENILHTLHTQLNQEHVLARIHSLAISGLGGIGKTQVAIEYAYRHANSYTAVFWISAETAESITASFLLLANLLNLPEREQADQARMIRAVLHWLATTSGWLLIWDNIEEFDLLTRFLPFPRQGSILLTTRCRTWGTLALRLELVPLAEEEGTLFLLRRARLLDPPASQEQLVAFARDAPTEHAAARELVKITGGLPLALDQVGAYVEETPCSLTDYLQLYRTRTADLLQRRGKAPTNHPEPVATTWSLSFERVARLNQASADLLRLCACLHPDAIPEEIFTLGAPVLGEQLAPVTSDILLLHETIGTLSAYSLVSRHVQDQTLSIHRLVHTVLRETLDTAAILQWSTRAAQALDAQFPEPGAALWSSSERLERCIPHVQAYAQFIKQAAISHQREAADVLYKAGYYLERRGRYAEAEGLLTQALAIREDVDGPLHLEVAAVLYRLALALLFQEKCEQASLFLQRALAIREALLGVTDPLIAESLNGIALSAWMQQQYEQAEPLFQRTLAIHESCLGSDHPEVARTLNNLAGLYRDWGKDERVEPLLRQAFALRQEQLGPDHVDTADSLQDLGLLYLKREEYEQAEACSRRALAIRERHFGPTHHDVSASLHALGQIYLKQGKDEQAEPFLRRALLLLEQEFGGEHCETIEVRDAYNRVRGVLQAARTHTNPGEDA